jgi:hypothetical protein
LEQLEGRVVPSTLEANFGLGGQVFAHYTASSGVDNNVTLSERILPIGFRFLREIVLTDTAEKINVVGTAAGGFQGSGTNTVTTLLPLHSLRVDVLDGNDTVNVQAINYLTDVRHVGAGVDTVNVGNSGSLLGIQASLGVEEAGAASSTHLNVDDSADNANRNVLLFGGQINNLAPASIVYSSALNPSSSVTVTGGGGDNVYTVDGTLSPTTLNTGGGKNQVFVEDTGAPLTVQGHGGTDRVVIGSNPSGNGGNVLDIRGRVDVRNTKPLTTLTVDDSTDPGAHPAVSLSDSALTGLAPAAITYQKGGLNPFSPLEVHGGDGADTFTVPDTPGFTSIGLGKGPHRVNVEGLTGGLGIAPRLGFAVTGQTLVVVGSNPSGSGGTQANIHGQLFLADLGGSIIPSTVIVDDSGDGAARAVSLTASGGNGNNMGTVTGLAPGATVRWFNIINNTNLIVNGGSGGDTFNVADTGATLLSTTINTGTGANHVNVRGTSSPLNVVGHGGSDTVTVGSLAPLLGGTLANIHAAVNVSNTTNSTALIVDDSGDAVFRSVTVASNSVQFSGRAPIRFFAGVKSVDVSGGTGGDAFTLVAPYGATPVTLHGGPAVNDLVSGGGPNHWALTGNDAGTLHNVAFQNVRNLLGGAASTFDVFSFAPGGSVDGLLAGGGGGGELDFQALSTRVFVDLLLNLAVLGPTPKFTVLNLRNVLAGSGDTLVVGNGNNFFQGGSGRDVFISHGGNSTLVAGSGEAILIGGTTARDTNVPALDAILAEWSFTYDPINPLNDYRIRVGHLEHGGGKNGAVVLNPATVHTNSSKDVLETDLPGGLDFVFFDAFDLLPHGPRAGEVFVLV